VSSDGADRGFVLELRQWYIHVSLMNEVRQLGEEAGGAWDGPADGVLRQPLDAAVPG
jgi:hypothetical protein